MTTDLDAPDNDTEALARRMERSAEKIERLAGDFGKGGIERTLENALKRNRKELERQMSSLLRDTLSSALGGGGARGGGGGLTALIGSFIPGFARGGMIGGRSLIAGAGEAGPEVILPLRRGRDGRLGVVAASGGGRNPASTAASPQRVEVRIVGDDGGASAALHGHDDAFREAVASAVAEALDGAIDERIALHTRAGGMLGAGRGWQ